MNGPAAIPHPILLLFAGVALSIFTGCGVSINTSIADPRARVDAYISDRLANNDFPGIQYLVVSADSVLYHASAGLADIGAGRPMSDAELMMAYSMTKTITAIAVLQLVEQGALDLDAPITRYVPYQPYGDEVLIRHLLAQTSGIPNPIPLKWVHLAEDDATFNEDSTLRSILAEYPELDDPPGEDYAYSNISYWLLGATIEAVTGQRYAEVIRERILSPLRIPEEEACFTTDDTSHLAAGYLREWSWLDIFKGWVMDDVYFGPYENGWMRFKRHYLNGPAFGGLICTPRALARVLQDLLRPTSTLLTGLGRDYLFMVQRGADGDLVPMTLGWHLDPDRPGMYFKEGGGGGFHGMMRVYRNAGTASIVVVNATRFDAAGFLDVCDPLIAPK